MVLPLPFFPMRPQLPLNHSGTPQSCPQPAVAACAVFAHPKSRVHVSVPTKGRSSSGLLARPRFQPPPPPPRAQCTEIPCNTAWGTGQLRVVVSDRLAYIEELMRHVPVHSYGRCLNNRPWPKVLWPSPSRVSAAHASGCRSAPSGETRWGGGCCQRRGGRTIFEGGPPRVQTHPPATGWVSWKVHVQGPFVRNYVGGGRGLGGSHGGSDVLERPYTGGGGGVTTPPGPPPSSPSNV